MKILHCIPTMEGGGAERQLTYLASGLVRRGMDTHVAFCRRGPNFARLQASGATLHQLDIPGNYSPRLPWALLRLVRSLQPDAIQTWITQMDIAAGAVARLTRTPWILTERNSALCYPPSWKHFLRVRLGVRAAALVANSRAGCDYWKPRLPMRVPRYVISNALPFDAIDQARPVGSELARTGIQPGEQLVLYVGRFHSSKNLATLLRALKQASATTRFRAVFCGDGSDRTDLERRIVELGLTGRMHLYGYVANAWEWMKRADVFVSVSHTEGHPNTVMEAMACGAPLVVSDIAAHREFLNEQSAQLVDPNAPEAIANAICDTLQHPAAAHYRAALAREGARGWSVDTMTARYVEVYEEVLNKRLNSAEQCELAFPTKGSRSQPDRPQPLAI